MKTLAIALLIVFAFEGVSQAGFIFRRKASGRPPVGSRVFGGSCSSGACGR